jgi:hypothetical protein
MGRPELREGRAVAVAGSWRSVCTTAVSTAFLATCKGVRKADVPHEWARTF